MTRTDSRWVNVLLVVMSQVVRGPNWKSLAKDGGAGRMGTVINHLLTGGVRVDWDDGDKGKKNCN
jgi:hypothetical protein